MCAHGRREVSSNSERPSYLGPASYSTHPGMVMLLSDTLTQGRDARIKSCQRGESAAACGLLMPRADLELLD